MLQIDRSSSDVATDPAGLGVLAAGRCADVKKGAKAPFLSGTVSASLRQLGAGLDHTLCQHGVCHFDKAGHVGAVDVAHSAIGAAAVFETGSVDALHDQ